MISNLIHTQFGRYAREKANLLIRLQAGILSIFSLKTKNSKQLLAINPNDNEQVVVTTLYVA